MSRRSILLIFFAAFGIQTSTLGDDSSYDLEHKLLKSITGLEDDHDDIKGLIRNYQQQEDDNPETANILEVLQKTIGNIQAALKSQSADIQAVGDKVDRTTAETEKSLRIHGDKIGNLETDVQTQFQQLREFPGASSTFTRWGRSVCPTGSTVIYSGYVGGSHWTHSGAASTYLCLSKEPLWNQQVATRSPTYLYGAEYEFYDHPKFGAGLVNKEPSCAVCRSPRSTVIMIPGRNVCYGGWTTEYSGYLVAGHYTHEAASEFICLDINATPAEHTDSADQNGKLMYMVRTQCGSLPCPPYKNEWTVTCVVCSK